MGWRIVKQPDGKYALFSEITDSFHVYDMTREEAVAESLVRILSVEQATIDALAKVQRADDDPERWEHSLAIYKDVHGKDWKPE